MGKLNRYMRWLVALLVFAPGAGFAATVAVGGDYHGCAISPDGELKCWGSNSGGQTGSYSARAPVTVHGSGAVDYVDVVVADEYSCAISSTGAVRCWGRGTDGQLGNGSTATTGTPTDVVGLGSDAEAISVRDGHGCVVLATGGVKCWGRNASGQLGDGTTTPHPAPVDVSGLQSGIAGIAAGGEHTCALTADGGVKCWGSNQHGALGDGTTTDQHEPRDVPGLAGVTAIAAGEAHTCALLDDGTVKCWGMGDLGRLGDGTSDNHHAPNQVAGLPGPVVAIRLGATHSCALLSTGRLACWGGNADSQIGDGTTVDRFLPVVVPGLAGEVVDFDAGKWRSCARLVSGGLHCWGRDWLGNGANAGGSPVAVSVAGFPSPVSTIDTWMRCGIGEFARPYCWGSGSTAPVPFATFPSGVSALSTNLSNNRSCGLDGGGRVYCWGEGPLGDGGQGSSDSPVAVPGLPGDIVAITSGTAHHCALSVTGNVYCWGYNWDGQVGDGSNDARYLPVIVPALSGVVALSSRSMSTCALLAGGGVKCWGNNFNGELGDGTTTDRNAPVDVLGLASGVMAVSVSDDHACALMQTGGVKCWGDNSRGQLGDGTAVDRWTPVNVQNLSDVIAISAGGRHTCAVTGAGAAKCWGQATSGQLGTGAGGVVPDQPLPVDVLGLSSGMVAVSAGNSGTCALDGSGRAKCWGAAGIDTPSDFASHDSGERYGPVDVPTWYSDQQQIFRDGFDP